MVNKMDMKDKVGRVIRVAIYVISIALIGMVLLAVNGACAYTPMAGDDFSICVKSGVIGDDWGVRFSNAFVFSVIRYNQWQGGFIANILESAFNPIGLSYGRALLRLIMVFHSLLFFVAITFFLFVLFKHISNGEIGFVLPVLCLALITLFGYQFYEDAFCWYTASVEYVLTVDMALIGFGCYIRMHDGGVKIRFFVLSLLCGVISMGGIVAVCGFGCAGLMVIALYYLMRDRRLSRYDIIVFAVWVAGAAINAFAPGNFNRHGAIDESGIYPVHALFDAIYVTNHRWQMFCTEGNLLPVMMILVLIGVLIGRKQQEQADKVGILMISSLLSLVVPVITAYPVTLGYTSQLIPNRVEFLVDLGVILNAMFISICAGMCISRLKTINVTNVMVTMTLLICTTAMMDGYSLADIKYVEMTKELKNGIFARYYNECFEFYDTLQSYSAGADVILTQEDIPEPVPNMYVLELSEDPHNWVNRSMAELYGLGSIVLKSGEEVETDG